MKLTKEKLQQIIKEELENLSEMITPEEGERAKEKYPEHYELIYDNFLYIYQLMIKIFSCQLDSLIVYYQKYILTLLSLIRLLFQHAVYNHYPDFQTVS